MKILDPQSAVLTNPELISFMRTHPPRQADPKVGGYPVTDMRGLWSVQKEFTDYVETITPHILSYEEPPSRYMQTLLQRLYKFKLTKPEVLMIINLGIGVKKSPDPRQHDGEVQNGREAEGAGEGEEDLLDKVERHIDAVGKAPAEQSNDSLQMQGTADDHPDLSVLNTTVEEMYERFTDAELNEILQICQEVLSPQNPHDKALPANTQDG